MRRKTEPAHPRTPALIAVLLLLVLVALHAFGADAAAGEAAANALSQASLMGGSLLWRLLGVVGLCASVLILRRVAE